MAVLHFQKHEPNNFSDSNPILILLHGRGADEFDLLPIGEIINKNFLTFSIRAPKKFIYGGYTWFSLSDKMEINDDEFYSSFCDLNETINFILQNYKNRKIFLLGFSQGAIMSYSIGLTRSKDFTGIIAQSGFLFESNKIAIDWKNISNLKFLHTHGLFDTAVPIETAYTTKNIFENNYKNFELKTYQMGHEINQPCLSDVTNWVNHLI